MKEHLCKEVCQKDPPEIYKEGAFPMPWLKFREEGTVLQKNLIKSDNSNITRNLLDFRNKHNEF